MKLQVNTIMCDHEKSWCRMLHMTIALTHGDTTCNMTPVRTYEDTTCSMTPVLTHGDTTCSMTPVRTHEDITCSMTPAGSIDHVMKICHAALNSHPSSPFVPLAQICMPRPYCTHTRPGCCRVDKVEKNVWHRKIGHISEAAKPVCPRYVGPRYVGPRYVCLQYVCPRHVCPR